MDNKFLKILRLMILMSVIFSLMLHLTREHLTTAMMMANKVRMVIMGIVIKEMIVMMTMMMTVRRKR